jgi:hypothetical protein
LPAILKRYSMLQRRNGETGARLETLLWNLTRSELKAAKAINDFADGLSAGEAKDKLLFLSTPPLWKSLHDRLVDAIAKTKKEMQKRIDSVVKAVEGDQVVTQQRRALAALVLPAGFPQ